MVAISGEVLLVNQEIVVCIQLPKFAVHNIKMFIREIPEIFRIVHFLSLFQHTNSKIEKDFLLRFKNKKEKKRKPNSWFYGFVLLLTSHVT